MNDDQLLRYSRHILLPELGIEGQEKLLAAHALVIGAGGLGSPAALYLASAGIGRITLADGDTVDLTNLQRQILHATAAVGRPKSVSGRDTLARLTEVRVGRSRTVSRARGLTRCCRRRRRARLLGQLRDAPRRETRGVRHRRPLVSGAGVRFDGQISVYDLRRADSPCYACLFPEDAETEEMRCAVMGVFAPLTGIVGTMQAAEALKLVAGLGESLCGRLLLLDALRMDWRSIRLKKDPACKVCG
jgi:adenylyltransferase/sulfurtransferase